MSRIQRLRWHAACVRDAVMHTLRHPLARVTHVWRSDILAGPGYAGFAGGMFNPGSVIAADGSIEILAKGQHMHWRQALETDSNQFMFGAPVLLKLDPGGARRVGCDRIIELQRFPSDAKVEDFRIFRFGGCTLVNHCVTDVDPNNRLVQVRQALSRLDDAAGTLQLLGFPKLDIDVANREKNWVYLAADDQLLLFYSFSPLRVLRLSDADSLAFATLFHRDQPAPLADPGGLGTLVSFSTNPIPYDADHFLLVIHQIDHSHGLRRYLHWGVLLDRATLTPSHISQQPLFDGLGARGRAMQGVLYVTSVVATHSGFLFLSGEGDSFVTRMRMDRRDLDRRWVDARTT